MCPMDGAIIIRPIRPPSSSARAGTFLLPADDAFSGCHELLQVGQEHRHAADDASALSAPSKPTPSRSYLLEQNGQVLSASSSVGDGNSPEPISGFVESHRQAGMARRDYFRGAVS